MNIPNVRIESGLELRVRLKDNGVSLDWSSLQGVKALLYSVEQKAVAGAAEVAIDNENPQILIVKYPGSSPQYTGLAKLIVRCEYNGKQKTYDTAVANFVETTDEATGVIVLDDPTISVGISVEDVSTSLLDEAINAAFAAAEKAMSAAQQAKDEADKLPGIATNLQNAIDTAAATNSEIKSNESERLKSEQKRENSESARVAAEQARASAEEARKTAENSRINAESQRESNEAERQQIFEQNEQQRSQTFQQGEQSRQQTAGDAETQREQGFQTAQQERDAEFQRKEAERDAAMQTISQEAQKLTELQSKIDLKQDTISDLETIREGAALGKTALQKHQDISGLATKEEVAGKQDIIADLDSIRSGAAKGATALQSYTETDPVYMADKPKLALKSEIPDISGKADKTTIVTETEGLASYAISPNVLTKLGTLASSITLSLDTASEVAGVANVYEFVFTTPADAPSITWPVGITWVGGSAPAIAGGKTYEVSIMDNLATYGEY